MSASFTTPSNPSALITNRASVFELSNNNQTPPLLDNRLMDKLLHSEYIRDKVINRTGGTTQKEVYGFEHSPYRFIEFENLNKEEEGGGRNKKAHLMQGFMAERLRKQSVLNSNLFRKENVNYKEKI